MIPLSESILCPNCDSIYSFVEHNNQCPSCGSKEYMLLNKILNREEDHGPCEVSGCDTKGVHIFGMDVEGSLRSLSIRPNAGS